MLTIKIGSYADSETYPLFDSLKLKKENIAQPTKEVLLFSGTEIWHRKFHIFDVDQYDEWERFYGIDDCEDNKLVHVPGTHPHSILKKEDGNDYPLNFELLTFKNDSGKTNIFILLNVECYIMNENGQTVDKIVI